MHKDKIIDLSIVRNTQTQDVPASSRTAEIIPFNTQMSASALSDWNLDSELAERFELLLNARVEEVMSGILAITAAAEQAATVVQAQLEAAEAILTNAQLSLEEASAQLASAERARLDAEQVRAELTAMAQSGAHLFLQ